SRVAGHRIRGKSACPLWERLTPISNLHRHPQRCRLPEIANRLADLCQLLPGLLEVLLLYAVPLASRSLGTGVERLELAQGRFQFLGIGAALGLLRIGADDEHRAFRTRTF